MFFHCHLTVVDTETFPTGAALIYLAGAYGAADVRVATRANVVV